MVIVTRGVGPKNFDFCSLASEDFYEDIIDVGSKSQELASSICELSYELAVSLIYFAIRLRASNSSYLS